MRWRGSSPPADAIDMKKDQSWLPHKIVVPVSTLLIVTCRCSAPFTSPFRSGPTAIVQHLHYPLLQSLRQDPPRFPFCN